MKNKHNEDKPLAPSGQVSTSLGAINFSPLNKWYFMQTKMHSQYPESHGHKVKKAIAINIASCSGAEKKIVTDARRRPNTDTRAFRQNEGWVRVRMFLHINIS